MIPSPDEYLTSALATPAASIPARSSLACILNWSAQVDREVSLTGVYVVVTGLRAHNARITADLPSVES